MSSFLPLKPSRSVNIPLRVILIVMFVGQIIGAVGLVGYLSFRNGQQAVNDLASQLRKEISDRIEQELRGYFATPYEINRLNASAFALGQIDIKGATFGESQIYQQMKIASSVAVVYCGNEENGASFGVERSPNDGSLKLSYSNEKTNFFVQYYALDVIGQRTYFLYQEDQPYEPRQRPWYQAAMLAEQPIWTDVYIDFFTGRPNITASFPVYDRSGKKLLGVCATDIVLPEEFRTFLRNLRIGQNGTAFVLDRDGHLIADSSKDPLVAEGETEQVLEAANSRDPRVRQTTSYLTSRFNGLEGIRETQQLKFTIEGKRQFLEVVPFQDNFGLDWLIVVVVPEADFKAQINVNNRNTIVLCLGALAIAIAVAIVTSRWITKPIQHVSLASDRLAQGKLSWQVEPNFILEIDTLSNSFNTMTTKLEASFNALQQSEERFRGLVANIPGIIYRYQYDSTQIKTKNKLSDWKIEYISDSVFELSGYSHSDFYQGGWKNHYALIHPRDCNTIEATLDRAIAVREPYILDYRIQHQDGSIRWASERGRMIFAEDGKPLYLDGAIFDITQRHEAEEALRIAEENYRNIFENALDGIFQSSPEGRFLNVNPALARIYGYDSPQDAIASITNIGEQLYVDPQKRIEFKELLEKQDTVQDFEYRCYCKDGSIIWTQIDARQVKDQNGNVLYYEGLVQDITARKRREADLQRQLEELKIEIDRDKKEEEVAMLTSTSYFQEVQQEMDEMDLDNFWS